MSQEETQFINIVSKHIDTDERGNLVMPSSFKSGRPSMPNNSKAVFMRTKNTLDRLKKNEQKMTECLKCMQDSINAKHVEEIPKKDFELEEPGKGWWLPIFPVTHPKKQKTRLVFDSSATYSNTSLNKVLLAGPDENNRLNGVLQRFRERPIAFSGDVEKMFYAFRLFPEDSNYLRFFWYKNNNVNEPLVQYRALVHIFGNKPSPAIANFGLKYAADHPNDPNLSKAREFIYNNFYVDDGLGCEENVADAIATLSGARKLLSKNNIRLCKISSNSPEVIEHFPQSERAESVKIVEFDKSIIEKTLGVAWNVTNDKFVVKVSVNCKPFTRRGIVSVINSLFDPIGILSPVVLKGRLIQRRALPRTEDGKPGPLNWDEPLQLDLFNIWKSWIESLPSCNDMSIPRCFRNVQIQDVHRQELHIFADSSEEAVGYVIYIRTVCTNGTVNVTFATGNSKVAPRGATSIPRLELTAALEATIAGKKFTTESNIKFNDIVLYTDSLIVIGYLTNTERRFTKYITRRVHIITKTFPSSMWNYIETDKNPADIASRPHDPEELKETCWFNGPEFLKSNEVNKFTCNIPENLPETIKNAGCLNTNTTVEPPKSPICEIIRRVSSLKRAQYIVEHIRKFTRNLMKNANKIPQCDKFPDAISVIINTVQNEEFPHMKASLADNSEKISPSFLKLSPFVDEHGLIRVGGRLKNASLPLSVKHPILIPSKHPLTELIIRHYHNESYHQGRHITAGVLRQAGFFIEGGNRSIKKVISQCVICKHLRAPPQQPKMADLPADRLECTPPFTNTAVDVFGPYYIGEGRNTRRTNASKKIWVLLCTCLVSRAVHLEPLPAMDTPSFINALYRFTALRGTVKLLRSDCGSNFLGAMNQDLCDFNKVKENLANKNVKWLLNPARAPHFGGVFERKVGSVKRVLDAALHIMGSRMLSRDEFHTLIQQAASIVNNTPLWEVPNSPCDPEPMTPASLLTLRECYCNDFDVTTDDKTILAYGKGRWKRVQAVANNFWSKWRKHFISSLQGRLKWRHQKASIGEGDLVLISDKNSRRNLWPTGRVISTSRGSDGIARRALVKTTKGTYERAVCHLVLLQKYTSST